MLLVHVLRGEDFDSWKDEAFERLKSFGMLHECKAIEATCRLGLVKKLKSLKFKTRRAALRAEI